MRSRVQTESNSSSSASLVSSSSSLTVTLSRKFGKYRASFMRDGLLTVRQWVATAKLRSSGTLHATLVLIYGSGTSRVKRASGRCTGLERTCRLIERRGGADPVLDDAGSSLDRRGEHSGR